MYFTRCIAEFEMKQCLLDMYAKVRINAPLD